MKHNIYYSSLNMYVGSANFLSKKTEPYCNGFYLALLF